MTSNITLPTRSEAQARLEREYRELLDEHTRLGCRLAEVQKRLFASEQMPDGEGGIK